MADNRLEVGTNEHSADGAQLLNIFFQREVGNALVVTISKWMKDAKNANQKSRRNHIELFLAFTSNRNDIQ